MRRRKQRAAKKARATQPTEDKADGGLALALEDLGGSWLPERAAVLEVGGSAMADDGAVAHMAVDTAASSGGARDARSDTSQILADYMGMSHADLRETAGRHRVAVKGSKKALAKRLLFHELHECGGSCGFTCPPPPLQMESP